MTSNRPDAAPGSDQMFVMGICTPCSGPTIPGDDVEVWGDMKDTTSRFVRCPNSRSRAAGRAGGECTTCRDFA